MFILLPAENLQLHTIHILHAVSHGNVTINMIERDDMYPSLLYQECLSETTGRRSDRRSIAKEGVECTQPKDGQMGWIIFIPRPVLPISGTMAMAQGAEYSQGQD